MDCAPRAVEVARSSKVRKCSRQVTLEDLEKRLAAVEKSLEADGEGCAGCWSLAWGED